MRYFLMSALSLSLFFLLVGMSSPPADAPSSLYLSTDNGESWQPFGYGLPEGVSPNEVLEHDCDLYISTWQSGIFKLSAGTDRWERTSQGLPDKLGVLSLAARDQFMMLGTFDKGVYYSRNGGHHWQRSVFNPKGGAVHSLLFLDGRLIAGTERGVYHSWDLGFSWMRSGPAMPINDLARHRGKIYAARPDGIAVSEDGGDSWALTYQGEEVWKMMVDGDYVYGLLSGDGMIRSNDGTDWLLPTEENTGERATDLGSAIFRGLDPELPTDLRVRKVVATSRGWIAGLSPGC